jgi:hypothetical protein
MITPNRFRSCHPRSGVSKATPTPLGRSDRDERMKAISDLEQSISALEIPALGHSTISEHAAVHVLNSNTLAVVVLCGHNAHIIEDAIRVQDYATTDISTDHDIITLTL